MDEVDVQALEAVSHTAQEDLEDTSSKPVWEEDDAPAGSTSGSLLVYERGKAVRVSGPTHYHHLADGRVVAAYNGGTHHTEPGRDGGPDKVTKILAIHGG
jgi:hypothetical protein